MNRSTRTFVVVGIAVAVAALASFGVFQAIRRMPVREVEVRILLTADGPVFRLRGVRLELEAEQTVAESPGSRSTGSAGHNRAWRFASRARANDRPSSKARGPSSMWARRSAGTSASTPAPRITSPSRSTSSN